MSAMSEAEVTSAPTKSYRKRNILRLILVGTAALCIPAWMSLNILRGQSEWDEMEYDAQVQRYLAEKLDDEDYAELNMPEWLRRAGEEDGEGWEAEMAAAMSITDTDEPPLPPYSIEDAARATNLFHNGVGILVYEPSNDNFYLVYNDHRHAWSSSCVKLATSFRMFVYMLRDSFPERFQGPKSQEWAVVIGSGDYPHLHPNCLGSFPHPSPKCEQNHAPVLQFGSAFRHKEILPNMIAMPQPSGPNLLCFKVYLRHPGQTCKNLKGLTSFSSEWENLIPQVVWRGTDFGYLNHIEKLRKPFWGLDIKPQDFQSKDEADKKVEGTHAMRQSYDSLYPRWKGVVLTAEAEREAEEKNDNSLPWANIKFTSASPAARAKTDYSKFAECGIPAIGERMSIEDLAKYKYQIDLGGGGGTTWSGTHEKLAMPGLLFHHVTPTKDYIHDRMKPWVHYVPVAPDLTDLKEKYEWAESRPEAAKKIANQGSALMQHLISSEGFGWMYDKNFIEPVRRAMEAYQPVSVTHPGSSWREVLIKFGGSHAFSERMRCEGRTCSKTFGTMI